MHVGTDDFINALRGSLDKGYGFVPLIGTGLSAPSGIPIIREIEVYLARCIGKALGVEDGRFRHWRPQSDEWPPFDAATRNDTSEPDELRYWYQKIRDRLEWMRESETYNPLIKVFQEALGAMADWKTALQFLARVESEHPDFGADASSSNSSTATPDIVLGAPDNDVIDSFFLNVVRGKSPTLGHRMLASLAQVMRFQIVLTTNFDELIERAFEDAACPLIPFDVHLTAGLPPFRLVDGKRSIVKMHGGRYGLRADYSLDKPPSDDDRRSFASYLLGRSIQKPVWDGLVEDQHSGKDGLRSPNHLLVVGFSGSDRRIMELIDAAKKRLKERYHIDIRVFWIAYSKRDVESVSRQARQLKWISDKESEPGICILQHSQTGLLFLQMHQLLTRSLPPRDALFPSVSRLPFPPQLVPPDPAEKMLPAGGDGATRSTDSSGSETTAGIPHSSNLVDGGDKEFYRVRNQLKRRLEAMDGEQSRRRLICVSGSSHYGLTAIAASVFEEESNRGSQCIWFDMDDVASTDDLFEQLLDCVAQKQGEVDWTPVLLKRDAYKREAELNRLTAHSPRRWIVFLNAREGAGVTGFESLEPGYADELRRVYADDIRRMQEELFPNGWLDVPDGNHLARFNDRIQLRLREYTERDQRAGELVWNYYTELQAREDTANHCDFIELMDQICGNRCERFTVVLLYRGSAHPESGGVSVSDQAIDEALGLQAALEPFATTYLVKALLRAEFDKPIELQKPCLNFRHEETALRTKEWLYAHDVDDFNDELALQGRRAGRLTRPIRESLAPHLTIRKVQFLQALLSCRRTRPLSLLWSWAFHGDFESRAGGTERNIAGPTNITRQRIENTRRWVEQLENRNVLRRKVGGFTWLHSQTRRRVIHLLRHGSDVSGDNHTSPTSIPHWLYNAVQIHEGLAVWYLNLFHSSHDTMAAFEAARHWCECAASNLDAQRLLPPRRDAGNDAGDDSQVDAARVECPRDLSETIRSIREATRALEEARPFVLQEGFSKVTCRRLTNLRDRVMPKLMKRVTHSTSERAREWGLPRVNGGRRSFPPAFKQAFDEAIHRLQIVCTEVALDIAQEVSENQRAFRRLRELRKLWLMGPRPEDDYRERCKLEVNSDVVDDRHMADEFEFRDGLWQMEMERERNWFQNEERTRDRNDSHYQSRYIDWERKSATLCVATRAYGSAQKRLLRIYRTLIEWGGENWYEEWGDPWSPLTEGRPDAGLLTPRTIRAEVLPAAVKAVLQRVDPINASRHPLAAPPVWAVEALAGTALRHMQLAIVQAQARHLQYRILTEFRLIALSGDVEWKHIRDEIPALKKRIDTRGTGSRRAELEYFELCRECYNVFDRLHRFLPAENQDKRYYFDGQVAKTQLSTAVAGREPRDFAQAQRRLDEAVSIVLRRRDRSVSFPMAIIELHRAEIALYEARSPERPDSPGGTRPSLHQESAGQHHGAFYSLRQAVFRMIKGAFPVRDRHGKPVKLSRDPDQAARPGRFSDVGVELDRYQPCGSLHTLRQIWSDDLKWSFLDNESRMDEIRRNTRLLEDASDALDRAYAILIRNRKNVWWVTWYFELRLKQIEYSLFAAVLDEGRPIPYLGLQAAPRGLETDADKMLEQTMRMVRFDVFRMASVVMSYANCIRALFVRLVIDPRIDRMPLRQKNMHENLKEAIERLKKLRDHRNNIRPVVSDDVRCFVDFVLWDAQRALEQTPPLIA